MNASAVSPTRIGFEEIIFTARDGLRLYARHYPAPGSTRRPALCLAGITRNSRDFHTIATALSTDPVRPRPVYTIDTRGRGRSAHDPDWKNYIVPIEMLDVLDFITLRSLADVAIIGTSRGGIIAHWMSSFLSGIHRSICMPHRCRAALGNRNCEKGMRISAVQPLESSRVAAVHTGSY